MPNFDKTHSQGFYCVYTPWKKIIKKNSNDTWWVSWGKKKTKMGVLENVMPMWALSFLKHSTFIEEKLCVVRCFPTTLQHFMPLQLFYNLKITCLSH
jgi:hypothetical protein